MCCYTIIPCEMQTFENDTNCAEIKKNLIIRVLKFHKFTQMLMLFVQAVIHRICSKYFLLSTNKLVASCATR